ncbi:MAG: type II toxin-antitoxin system VapC family toxin, partial [Acidimicrobiales bacterium]
VLVVSALAQVEAKAALAAATRADRLSARQHRGAKAKIDELLGSAMRIGVSDGVIDAASDLAEQQSLRGYDAIHLASALGVRARVMVSADRDLCAAAQRTGMHVANPGA